MATGPDMSSAAAVQVVKKDRHIVSWSPEEDDLLRGQITLHGTDNWTIIAAQFKDKTSRQCRRRWYNYLNSECKKGGWSPEEDMLLCEAQKVLGNRWTEIAKVVSGRTDNAVKNRFSTLCKKRAKHEELKENGAPCSDANAKRMMTQIGCLTSGVGGFSPPIKQMSKPCTSDLKENAPPNERLFGQDKIIRQHPRQPLAMISLANQQNVNRVDTQSHVANNAVKPLFDVEKSCIKRQGNFLKRDDLKLATLLQQADLLCSLAVKVNTENTSQTTPGSLGQKEDNNIPESSMSGIASLLEDLDDLIVDPYDGKEEDDQQQMHRDHSGHIDTHDGRSNGASQTSMEATSEMILRYQKMDNCPLDESIKEDDLHKDVTSTSMELGLAGAEILASENLNETAENSMLQCMEFTSPAHTIPTFNMYTDGMPSPKFTASERNFLLSVLELTSPGSRPDNSQQPSCKRALLDSL